MFERDASFSGRDLSRRSLVAAGAVGALAATGALAQPQRPNAIPIIDAHIHLFDGSRPQGAPYMGSKAYAAMSKISLPNSYGKLARPAGIVGAIVVEASAWLEDNLWLLEVSQADPFIVGVVGRLDTASPDFPEFFNRFRKHPLFRGIRHSRFFAEEGGEVGLIPAAVEGMKLLANADIALDTANPTLALLKADLLLSKAVPDLRIIVDHLPSFDPTPQTQPAYEALIDQLAARPNIFVKLTEVYHPRADGSIVKDEAILHARLNYLFDAFGEDRVMFGTDYPNSYGVATIPESVALMKRFFADKPRIAAEKYFWKNSASIYKWRSRATSQPTLG